jgi:hypothetical protein
MSNRKYTFDSELQKNFLASKLGEKEMKENVLYEKLSHL